MQRDDAWWQNPGNGDRGFGWDLPLVHPSSKIDEHIRKLRKKWKSRSTWQA